MTLDLIEEEFEIFLKQTNSKFSCEFKKKKEIIEASTMEESLSILLTRFYEEREKNILKV
jgi:plasmid maintenance system killer protein